MSWGVPFVTCSGRTAVVRARGVEAVEDHFHDHKRILWWSALGAKPDPTTQNKCIPSAYKPVYAGILLRSGDSISSSACFGRFNPGIGCREACGNALNPRIGMLGAGRDCLLQLPMQMHDPNQAEGIPPHPVLRIRPAADRLARSKSILFWPRSALGEALVLAHCLIVWGIGVVFAR
jgi:hypothetical protein